MRIPLSLISILLVAYSDQRSTPQDDHYVAAVVEYEVSRNVEQNRINYVNLIEEAAKQNADIVVFPELTLTNSTTSVPVPLYGLLREYPIPAVRPDLYHELLVSISAAARDNGIYVVVNVRELMDCTNNNTGELCPELMEYIFNTNVVFDRTGAVIDRYRKINLFGEPRHTPALQPDLGVFTSDFGVTFGHFICFDLMFQVPAIQVVQKEKVTDVIFTTMWFSEMPYLTAVEIQQSYAYTMDVNFIASGANNVAIGSAGSGIYSGKAGALISIMPGLPTTRVLVAKVPKAPGLVTEAYPGPIYDDPANHDGLHLISDPSLPSHISRQLVPGFQEFTLIDKDVSCTFRVRMNQRNEETAPRFRAVVQDGSTTYSRRELGVAACLIVACKTDDFKSCNYRYNQTNAQIQELQIKMRTYSHQYNMTLKCDDIIYFPVSFRTNKFPLAPVNISYIDARQNYARDIQNEIPDSHNWVERKENGGRDHVTFKIRAPQDELVSFGIWGRIYTRDVDHNKHVTEEDIQKFDDILDVVYGIAKDN